MEYLFLVSPPDHIQQDVRDMKEKIHSRINLSAESRRSKAHISLFEFVRINHTEEEIIEKTNRVVNELDGFKVQLDGFGVFEHGKSKKTIILRIQNPQMIRELHSSLLDALNLRHRKMTPHLTVARSIASGDFDQLENDLLESDYSREFLCESISILKREVNDDFATNYSLVAEIDLKN